MCFQIEAFRNSIERAIFEMPDRKKETQSERKRCAAYDKLIVKKSGILIKYIIQDVEQFI